MLTASISQVKNGLSAYLRRVKAGDTVLIMDRKTPVARIVPLTDRTVSATTAIGDDRARIQRLIAQGIATRESDRDALELLRELGKSWPSGHGLLGALLEERDTAYQEGYR